jgi:hypothetical protein
MMGVVVVSTAHAQLKIDFTQIDGAVEAGYEGYFAGQENPITFTAQSYTAFGTTITLTPTWAADATAATMQMYRRAGGNYQWTGSHDDLIRDWIGTDNRQPGDPLTLTISGLPTGEYTWFSYHHDGDNQTGLFDVTVNDARGSTTITDIDITDTRVTDLVVDFENISTFTTTIFSNGTDDIAIDFHQQASAPVDRAFFVMNAFELTRIPPAIAKNPSPADEAEDVVLPVVLSWTPGEYAPAVNGHKVFLSDNLVDVSGGLPAAERGIVSDPVFDTAAHGLGLEYSTTYYWRVDEANVPGGAWDAGKVWSFTTEPYSIVLPGSRITATADSNDTGQGPENTINGSGLNADDLHSAELTDMWLSASGAPQPAWIQYEFDKVYKLHQMLVWNHNTGLELSVGFGIKEVVIEYSVDGASWSILGTTDEFARAPGATGYAANTTVDLEGAVAKYVKITANSNWGGIVTQAGLSEVRFFYVPVRARQPDPAPDATGVGVDNVTLNWLAGRGAASHEVYFSTNENAVIDETVSPVTIPVGGSHASYDTGELDLGRTYYWKVNEVNTAETPTTWQGDLWSFQTANLLVVDNFETYDDDYENFNRIFQVWIDGAGYTQPEPGRAGNGSGALVGTDSAPWVEQTIVHSGGQSMPLIYNNTVDPFYSEATRTFDAPQDWTKYGIKSLTLWFYGDPNSDTSEQMYAKLNGSMVTYDGNARNLTRNAWHEWNIDLRDFTGVDLGNVTELTIGLQRGGAAGGSGLMHFDDIRLYPARCRPDVRQPGADLNDDCVVDYLDLQIIGGQWLSSGLLVTPQPPGSAGLVAHYEFEGNIDDSVGTRHGTATGDPAFAAGKIGQAIDLDGIDDYVFIDGSFQLPLYTMAVWFRSDGGSAERDLLSAYAPGVQHGILLELQGSGALRYLHRYPLGGSGGSNVYSTNTYDDGAWHHTAIVKSDTEIALYVNGENEGSTPDSSVFEPGDAFGLAVGILDNERVLANPRHFVGGVDDIRIYERALSQAEVASLAGRTQTFSESFDLNVDGAVDFNDYANLCDSWLDEQLWPQP